MVKNLGVRAYAVAMNGARAIETELDRTEVAEVYGSLHLTAALASVTGAGSIKPLTTCG